LVKPLKKLIPPEWRAPLIVFIIVVSVLYYLYGGIPFETTTLGDYVPLGISVAIIALIMYLRRLNKGFREFMTPGNVIFWGVIIISLVYLIWLGLT